MRSKIKVFFPPNSSDIYKLFMPYKISLIDSDSHIHINLYHCYSFCKLNNI